MIKKILCIDDVKSNLFTLKSVLQSSKEYTFEVYTALSAAEGFEILAKEPIDLILLDVMMPEVDGFSMAKMLKKNRRTREIPFIFITAKKDDETIDACYAVGGVDYVSKPFNTTELLHRVTFHIKSKEQARLLVQKQQFLQKLIDTQDSFLAVGDGYELQLINKAMLEFVGLDSAETFKERFGCICNLFRECEGCFHLGLVPEGVYWADYVMEYLKKENAIVAMEDKNGILCYFSLKVAKFEHRYIYTLHDITQNFLRTKQYEHDASYDPLTQVYNRNMLYTVLKKIFQEQRHMSQEIAFCMLDIDHFKEVNDTYGHLVGDTVLVHLAELLKKNTRQSDIVARWGGEEFVLILELPFDKALQVVEHLRQRIAKEHFEGVGHITCSFGLTQIRPDDTIETVSKRADDALYKAKEGGRNRVCQI